jgi:hypothetical protein
MLKNVMLNVVMPIVVILSVVPPLWPLYVRLSLLISKTV